MSVQRPEPRSAGALPSCDAMLPLVGVGKGPESLLHLGDMLPAVHGALRSHVLPGRPAVMRHTAGTATWTGCSSLPAPAAHHVASAGCSVTHRGFLSDTPTVP